MEPRLSENAPSVCGPPATFKVARNLGRQKHDPSGLTPFARALREARVAAGVPQVVLARSLGVTNAAIANVELAKTGSSAMLSEQNVRAAAELFGCDPAPMLAARERSLLSYRLPNLSEEHAETAIALRDAWETASPETLRRVRAALAGETP